MTSIQLGSYAVTVRERPPCPPQYIVMRAGKVVGYSASMPNAEQCADIERFAREGRYAEAPVKAFNYRLSPRGRTGRPTNAARAKADTELLKIPTDD
jgi:hypothetical protein